MSSKLTLLLLWASEKEIKEMVTGWTSQKGDSAVLRVGCRVSAKRRRGQPSVSRFPKRNHSGAYCLVREHRLQGPGDSGGMEGGSGGWESSLHLPAGAQEGANSSHSWEGIPRRSTFPVSGGQAGLLRKWCPQPVGQRRGCSLGHVVLNTEAVSWKNRSDSTEETLETRTWVREKFWEHQAILDHVRRKIRYRKWPVS